jgi:hypothetical protein
VHRTYRDHGYRIPNGAPGPSTARAQFGPVLCSPTLCDLMAFSCRVVSGVVPGWRPRHGPMADFSGRAGPTLKTARWAGARPGTTTHRGGGRGAGHWPPGPGAAALPATTREEGAAA